MRRLPGPADYRPGEGGNSRGSLRVVSGLAENTNSIFCDGSLRSLRQQMDVRFCLMQEPSAERQTRAAMDRDQPITRSPERGQKTRAFILTSDLHGWAVIQPELRNRFNNYIPHIRW